MMKKCNVCGKRLKLKSLYRYKVTKRPIGLNALIREPVIYEAFDCQNCGCQNIVNIREDELIEQEALDE